MAVPLSVLIAEDSPDDTLLLIRELRHGGFEPYYERVESAESMRAALAQDKWDLVISDHKMPAFSSTEVLNEVHNSQLDLPVIIVSGNIGEEFAVEAMRAGAHDYIMKNNLRRLALPPNHNEFLRHSGKLVELIDCISNRGGQLRWLREATAT